MQLVKDASVRLTEYMKKEGEIYLDAILFQYTGVT